MGKISEIVALIFKKQSVAQDADSTYRAALLAEIELHKAEYSSLRDEILQWLESERQLLNLSIIAIGAGLGFLPFILEQGAFIVFLLYPLVFHVLLWEMLSSSKNTADLSNYLTSTLIPRVNTILDELGDNRRGVVSLGWEIQVAKRPVEASYLMVVSITPTRHWVPILAVAALLISYTVVARTQGYTPTIIEILLVFLNLIFLVLAALRNLSIIRSTIQSSRRMQDEKL